jgi:hypothetical protein
MQKLDFKFPLTVSTVHFVISTVGAHISIKVLKVKPLIEVNRHDRWRRIFPMACVFCVNIVLGNVSLRYIPVSFMQTIKSFTPATTGRLPNYPNHNPQLLLLLLHFFFPQRVMVVCFVLQCFCSGWCGKSRLIAVCGYH